MDPTTIYRIRKWEEVFENHRTSPLRKLRWVPVPNDLNGDGYTELVDHEQGAAHYGVWIATVCIASRCHPRGVLVRKHQEPHRPASIARIARLPNDVVTDAWNRFVSIGWLEPLDEAQFLALAAQEPCLEGKEGKGREHPPYSPPRGAVVAIYEAYPRKVGRGAALKAIERALFRIAKDPPDGQEPHVWLLLRTKKYAASKRAQKPAAGERDYRPHPATWYNQERYDDDEKEWGGAA
ncbi:MAG: hypothetical protein JSV79_03840 [Armatimonadota bacterium]|nr:MAG: hypothetical protein JSV79_03840 [Armatimonadota bacterium]